MGWLETLTNRRRRHAADYLSEQIKAEIKAMDAEMKKAKKRYG
jgi:hypothetical protein